MENDVYERLKQELVTKISDTEKELESKKLELNICKVKNTVYGECNGGKDREYYTNALISLDPIIDSLENECEQLQEKIRRSKQELKVVNKFI